MAIRRPSPWVEYVDFNTRYLRAHPAPSQLLRLLALVTFGTTPRMSKRTIGFYRVDIEFIPHCREAWWEICGRGWTKANFFLGNQFRRYCRRCCKLSSRYIYIFRTRAQRRRFRMFWRKCVSIIEKKEGKNEIDTNLRNLRWEFSVWYTRYRYLSLKQYSIRSICTEYARKAYK